VITALALGALFGVGYAPLDSQVVIGRYVSALEALPTPPAMIFTYDMSQAGPTDIDQRHVVYRSGNRVRDETIEQNGTPLKRRMVHVRRQADPYTMSALAPRVEDYELLFVRTIRDGKHLDYIYRAVPLRAEAVGFSVDRVTIDGSSYLPRVINFHSSNGTGIDGAGSIQFARFGRYWMPTVASASAVIGGAVARERITFSDYTFPKSLPRSTFL
jgi:hypothetical protein